jgi:hypothetical protein
MAKDKNIRRKLKNNKKYKKGGSSVKTRKKIGRLTKYQKDNPDMGVLPPPPGKTPDDLKIKDIEIKKELLNSDPKFKMIFREFSKLPYVDIPMQPYEERLKLYDKWSLSGKFEDIPSETEFYIYKNNAQKLSHLEWAYNEYMAQQKENKLSNPTKAGSKKKLRKKNKNNSK